MTMTIRAHFDGKVLVPDQPLDLPLDLPLELELRVPAVEREPVPEKIIEDRRARMSRFTGYIKSAPHVPLESLRRENLYSDEQS
jgi:hypothetical protein